MGLSEVFRSPNRARRLGQRDPESPSTATEVTAVARPVLQSGLWPANSGAEEDSVEGRRPAQTTADGRGRPAPDDGQGRPAPRAPRALWNNPRRSAFSRQSFEVPDERSG